MMVAGFLLSGCVGSILDSDAVEVVPCDAPVEIPDRAINDREIEILWGRDRTALRSCGDKFLTQSGVDLSDAGGPLSGSRRSGG